MKARDVFNMFPAEALVDRPLPLEAFYKNNRMTQAGRDRFLRLCHSASIIYNITPENSRLKEVRRADADFLEIQVVEIGVKKKQIWWKDLDAFLCVVFQSIPYPVVCVLNYEDHDFRLATCSFHKRKADSAKNVVDEIYKGMWIDSMNIQAIDESLFECIKTPARWVTDLKLLYTSFQIALEKHHAAWSENKKVEKGIKCNAIRTHFTDIESTMIDFSKRDGKCDYYGDLYGEESERNARFAENDLYWQDHRQR